MDREHDEIELGTASVETKGGSGIVLDQKNGQGAAGLTDD